MNQTTYSRIMDAALEAAPIPGLEALIPTREAPRRRSGGAAPAREPRTLEEALGDVCGRFCGPSNAARDLHDPACWILRRDVSNLRSAAARNPRVIPSRTTDPDTSRRTEPRPVTANNARGKLLAAFHRAGPGGCTDETAARGAGVSLSSEYAKRCSELRDARLIEVTGDTRVSPSSGKQRIVSRITHAGVLALAAAGVPDVP